MINTYISIDLETTGLNPRQDRIIEIGAVKVAEGRITDTFSALVNPGRRLEERIVELTGITDEDLAGQPYIDEVLPELLDFMEERPREKSGAASEALPLLGHSILFDYSFLKKAAVDQKLTFEKQAIDTLKIARKFLAELEHRSLDYLCEYYGIPHHAHRALADAEATHILYHKLAKAFYTGEEPLFRPQQLAFKVKRDTPITKTQKERLYRLLELHNVKPEMDVERMTRSDADRQIDKLLAKFGRV